MLIFTAGIAAVPTAETRLTSRCAVWPLVAVCALGGLPALARAANAAPSPAASVPAVVAVNREIGLSMTGNFENLTKSIGRNYTSTYQNSPGNNYTSFQGEHIHRTGWTPGFRADAQYMFDTSFLKHLYVAASFNLDDGDVTYNGRTHWNVTEASGRHFTDHARYSDGENRSSINVNGEIGKAFLLLDDRLLVMPTAQGGYRAGGYDTFTRDGKGYVGMALHIDYAITDRLVIRGRAGWAQYLHAHNYFVGSATGTSGKSSRPEWSGDIGLDYRLTERFHLTGGIRYTYMNIGHAHGAYSSSYGSYWSGSETDSGRNWRNGVQLRLGAAYQL